MIRCYKLRACLLSAILPLVAVAQYDLPQNKVWAMGNYTGLDFNAPGNPVPLSTSLNDAISGAAASVCDEQGQLLFYSNGKQVWTAAGTLMPNGQALIGGSQAGNAIQGTLIVPFIGTSENRSKYYLFTLDNSWTANLYCNLVDMSLNNGLGDVDTTFSLIGTLLADSLSGKMIAIPGCNNNIWILVHEVKRAVFLAIEVNEAGINLNTVVSDLSSQIPASPFHSYMNGELRAAPDRSRILACNYQTSSYGIALFDFNYSTGLVSNPIKLDTTIAYFGGAFSPDGSKIYARGWLWAGGGFATYQFDLNAPDPVLSKFNLGIFNSMMSSMRLGPDGKIYFGSGNDFGYGYYHLGRINDPNNAGSSCNLEDSIPGITFSFQSADTILGQCFPNEVVSPGSGLNPVTLILNNDTLRAAPENYTSYQWYNNGVSIPGATNAYYVVQTNGWFSVKVSNGPDCTDSAAIEVTGYTDTSIGITNRDFWKQKIKVYPNPAGNFIQVAAPAKLSLTLYCISGRRIAEERRTNRMDLQGLANGLYFLEIRNQSGVFIKMEKIIKGN